MSAQAAPAAWRPKHGPWIIAASVMLATFMEVLDTSVANVSLPHFAGSLSATPEEATWVLTSYLVANAIVLPMTSWMSGYFGRKRYLLFSITTFTLSSALCGMANSLPTLVLWRIFQGLGGGGLQPLAQAVLLESFLPEERGVAMAAYGMGVIVAPIIGPTLGGWITDTYSWRWIFYINIPIGILAILMVRAFLEDPPYLRKVRGEKVDYWGFALLALWIGTFQVVLDKGQEADWLGAVWVRWGLFIAAAGFVAFVVRELSVEHPITDLRVLKNRNFAIGCALITVLGGVLYATTALLPLYLQTTMGYTAYLSGLALSPRGLGSFLSMLVVGRLVKKIDNRWLNAFGFLVVGSSGWYLSHINLDISIWSIIWPVVVNGFGLGFVFVPLTTLSVATLRTEEINIATSIYSLTRNIGAAVGIAGVTTLLERKSQVHQALLIPHLTPYDPAYLRWLQAAGAGLSSQQSFGALYGMVLRQARLLAFVDNFKLISFLCFAFAPLVFLFAKPKWGAKTEIAAH